MMSTRMYTLKSHQLDNVGEILSMGETYFETAQLTQVRRWSQ